MLTSKTLRVFWILATVAGTAFDRTALAAPTLFPGRDGVRLELDSGAAVDLGLPADLALETVAGTDASWIALGTRSRGDRRELFVLLGQGASGPRRFLPSLPSSSPVQAHAVALTAGARLAGLVWLEGTDSRSLAVKAARFKNGRWSAPQTISPPGPGSQLALAAALLADGSYVLAWSAFDGEDDEILWSHGRPGFAWTAPRPVASGNRVPDITPALVSTAGGALLSWARFDGNDYRVMTSAFAADRDASANPWSAPRTVGPKGSVFPTLERTADGIRLLARTAAPRGWEAVETDALGKPLRRAAISTAGSPADDRADRPRLLPTAAAVTFRWPGGAKDAIADLSARWSEEP
ncbi:MAG TPA: hypothetical protein VGS22_05500 [Thermoanaerobaculia bacterium]|jgi:hypothetical protein|nr:hypothetical protein [Thermoanaerobaculia bacterium]